MAKGRAVGVIRRGQIAAAIVVCGLALTLRAQSTTFVVRRIEAMGLHRFTEGVCQSDSTIAK